MLGHPAVAVSSVLLFFMICRGRAGPEKSASVLQGRSQGTRWKASCQLVSMLGFCTKCQCFSLICFALHRVGLQHFGEWPVLRSLSRLQLLLFEARLSGYCVREGESRDLGS